MGGTLRYTGRLPSLWGWEDGIQPKANVSEVLPGAGMGLVFWCIVILELDTTGPGLELA